jgi:phenylalanyl-tRNA synthetase beta chain
MPRVPMAWLADHVELPADLTVEQLATDLVRVGIEDEAIHGAAVTGPLVVGRVLELVEEPQNNGKVIRWCQVDVGPHNTEDGSPRGIVCGAHNFAVGDLVVVALPGCVLPGPFAITARGSSCCPRWASRPSRAPTPRSCSASARPCSRST